MNGWIEKVVACTAEAESPERFQYWAALTAISAVLKKNVYMDRFYYKLYPNIYVFLVGRSGLRKGNPVILAKKLVTEAKTARIVTGRNSIQAVLKELGRSYSTPEGGVIKEASGYLVSGELGAFLVKDMDALTILTDLYDTHANEPEWKNTMKNTGIDVLKNPCLTLLGATNEDHFKTAVPANQIGGGFMARTIVVFEEKRRVINDLQDAPKVLPNIEDLACYLKELSKVTGVFTPNEGETKKIYRDWYHGLEMESGPDKTGTLERIGDTVLKVAMLLSLSDSFDLVIKPWHMQQAIHKCMECLAGLKHVTMGAGGKSPLADQTALILKELLKAPDHIRTRKQILSKYWGELDSLELDRIMETLNQSGAVDIQARGKEMVYTMKKSAVDAYTKFKQEIQ